MPKPTKDIPAEYHDILEAKCFPHVATMRPDGMISNNPICALWDGEYLRFSTTKGRVKYHNMVADDRVALSIPDPKNIWRYIEIRGRVTLEDDVDRSFINQVARKYMDQDEYPFDRPGDERVTATVHPEQVSALGVNPQYNDGQIPEDWTKG
jgi:PPOX class probable F420-dependent enzyme